MDRIMGNLWVLTLTRIMKTLLSVANSLSLSRRIAGSFLLLNAAMLFCFAFWMAVPSAKAQDYVGASDPKKCTICHVPPGNPPNAHTISVGCSAVSAHLKNHPGDCVGSCPCSASR